MGNQDISNPTRREFLAAAGAATAATAIGDVHTIACQLYQIVDVL